MLVDFRNTNTVWSSILVETLYRLGLTTAIVCPGSRSAPLAVAFAQHPAIDAIPVLDERSAAFFALGYARRTDQPIALICTSGTAGANFYPAVIEARESRIPLLILTADRPPELRDCNAGQAIDQQKLYGSFVNWYSELALPALDPTLLAYLRQTLIHAWQQAIDPVPGPVHLNLPFRDPLAPQPQPEAQTFANHFNPTQFFARSWSQASPQPSPPLPSLRSATSTHPSPSLRALRLCGESPPSCSRPLIIAGVAHPHSPRQYCEAIARLSRAFNAPVLAEGISPVRNYAALNPALVATYDFILRDVELAKKLLPDGVIRIGEMPTSKTLRQWLQRSQPEQWVIDPGDRNLDPLHLRTTHLRISVEQFADEVMNHWQQDAVNEETIEYRELWQQAEESTARSLYDTLKHEERITEGKVAWILSQHLPERTSLSIANSTVVRDMEWYWQPGNRSIQPFCNRGANGIDGTLSTALGIAHRDRSSVLLTGDLALLHDTNGFLLTQKFVGHLTIVLINNQGGGIFERLPIAQFEPPFEEFFATPQSIDFQQLCATYQVEYELIQSWQHLSQRLNPLPEQGVRVLEVRCDRKADARWQSEFFQQFHR